MSLTRRAAFALTAATLAAPVALRAEARQRSTLAEALDLGYRSGLLDTLHGVHLLQNGEVALDAWFSGPDENWGRALGHRTFNAKELHDLRSVTKSITSLLYGIALGRGQVPGLDAPLLDSFPGYPALRADPARADWTVAHALNMTLGTDWNESLPYSDPRNSEIAMENADDRYRFVLSRDIVTPPGRSWNYSGGATALIGAIIERGVRQNLPDFAKTALFDPLGIDRFEWNAGRDGVPSAASGLRMGGADLAKIGEMMRRNGSWKGQQIVPASWLERLMQPQIATTFGSQYSHFWYLSSQYHPGSRSRSSMIHAAGNGGQRLYVIPEQDLVMVVFAGGYNRVDDWMTPTLILQRLVLIHI